MDIFNLCYAGEDQEIHFLCESQIQDLQNLLNDRFPPILKFAHGLADLQSALNKARPERF